MGYIYLVISSVEAMFLQNFKIQCSIFPSMRHKYICYEGIKSRVEKNYNRKQTYILIMCHVPCLFSFLYQIPADHMAATSIPIYKTCRIGANTSTTTY